MVTADDPSFQYSRNYNNFQSLIEASLIVDRKKSAFYEDNKSSSNNITPLSEIISSTMNTIIDSPRKNHAHVELKKTGLESSESENEDDADSKSTKSKTEEEEDDEEELILDLDANLIQVAAKNSANDEKEQKDSETSDDDDDDGENVILDLDNNTFIKNINQTKSEQTVLSTKATIGKSSITITKLNSKNENVGSKNSNENT
jgi:hypothetical protein